MALYNNQVYVYAALDVSGSMQGSKIEQLYKSMVEIIDELPAGSVMYDITLFHNKAYKIRSCILGSASILDKGELLRELQDGVQLGRQTALYDAWGDLLHGIPKNVLENNEVQIIILTDGEDNASTRYTSTSVLDLTKQILRQNVKFNYVQVGQNVNQGIQRSLKQITAGNPQLETHRVDNNAAGIQTALSSVKSDILSSSKRASKRSLPVLKTPSAPPLTQNEFQKFPLPGTSSGCGGTSNDLAGSANSETGNQMSDLLSTSKGSRSKNSSRSLNNSGSYSTSATLKANNDNDPTFSNNGSSKSYQLK